MSKVLNPEANPCNSGCCPRAVSLTSTAVMAFVLAFPPHVQAETFYCSSGNVACLIAAIQLANVNGQGNTIRLEAGTYTLTAVDNATDGPNALPSIIGSVTIRGAGADKTQIARAPNAPQFRLLHVAAAGNLTLDRLNLTGGRVVLTPFQGGALYNNGGVVNIVRTTIAQNFAPNGTGWALFSREGTINIRRSTFAGNSADGYGGLLTNGGTVRITQSRFTQNTAGHEVGGIGVHGGEVFITSSTFDRNLADGAGAIRVANNALLVVTDSAFIENTAAQSGAGAGILNVGGTAVVTNATFARNILAHSFFGEGSAIANITGTLLLTNSTLAENTTAQPEREVASALFGGAGGTTLVHNTIIANNASSGSPQDCAGAIRSLGNNLIGDLTGCDVILQPTDLTGDPGLGPFTDNGSPGNGHFPLLSTIRQSTLVTMPRVPKKIKSGKKEGDSARLEP